MKYKQVQIVIHGRVQGVGFRYSTHEKAVELGLGGWVRNRPTGEVEAFASGPEDTVNAFLEWCHRGPALAKVLAVKMVREEMTDTVTEKEFRILR